MYSIGWLAQNCSESGKWNVESGKRKVESEIFWLAGFWKVTFGKWKVECDFWKVRTFSYITL